MSRRFLLAWLWIALVAICSGMPSDAAFGGAFPVFSPYAPPALKPTITSVSFVDTAGGAVVVEGTNFVGVPDAIATINSVDYKLQRVANSGGGTILTASLDTSAGPYTVGGWTLTVKNPDGESAQLAGSGVNNCTSGFVVFTPECLSNLQYDFDSSTGVTCASGGTCTDGATTVDNWADISGNSVVATASGGARATYHTAVQNGYASVDGNGSSTWLTTNNITWGVKVGLVCGVFKVPASNDNAVIYEHTNNAHAGSVNGFGLLYRASSAGPQFEVYTGSSGNSTLNNVNTVVGLDTNSNYRAACFAYDRTATYPVSIGIGQAIQETSYYAGARAGEGYITAQTSASNFDAAPLSLFARNNGSGSAAAPSKVSFLRLFAYKSIPNVATIHNILTALQSRYATVLTPYTGQLVVAGDSIYSVFDSNGSLSNTTYSYVNRFFDNRQYDVLAVSGWSANDANANRTTWSAIRRADVPSDFVVALGTNDLGTNDTLSPSTFWTGTYQPLLSYLHGLSAPAVRKLYVSTILPRGISTAGSSGAISFEARREGLKEDGTALDDWAATHSYSINDWIYRTCSSTLTLFRVTTGGTSDGSAPTFTCTDGATTNEVGVVRWKSYGLPINVLLRDATNQSTNGYTVVNVGDPATPLGTCANIRSLTYYLADAIHPQPTYQTGQLVPSVPNGPPFANSILSYWYPLLKETGPAGIPYPPPVLSTVALQAGGGTTAALGAPVTLTGHSLGEPDPTHPLVLVDGSNVSWDFTAFTRTTDQIVSAVTPTGIALGGPYTIIYKRADGATATLNAALTIAQPAITAVAVASDSAHTGIAPVAAVTLPTVTLNTFAVKLSVSLGGGFGVTAATYKGVSLTSCTSNATGATITCTLGIATNSAGSGNCAATTPSSPTTLTNGCNFGTVDPTTCWSTSTQLAAWYRGDSVVGSPATGWTNKSTTIGTNLLACTNSPTVTAASSAVTQNGTGQQTVTFDGSTQHCDLTSTFTINTVQPTPTSLHAVMRLTATQVNNGRIARYSNAGGGFSIGVVSNANLTPVADSTFTINWSAAMGTTNAFAIIGSNNGLGTTSSAAQLNVNDGTELTATGSMTGAGVNKTGTFNISPSPIFSGAEVAEVVVTNVQDTTAMETCYWTYAHNFFNTPFTIAQGAPRDDTQVWAALGVLAGAVFFQRRRRGANDNGDAAERRAA